VHETGGIVGLRDDGVGSFILVPALPKMDRVIDLFHGLVWLSGGIRTSSSFPRCIYARRAAAAGAMEGWRRCVAQGGM
jgi:hypothetical protein